MKNYASQIELPPEVVNMPIIIKIIGPSGVVYEKYSFGPVSIEKDINAYIKKEQASGNYYVADKNIDNINRHPKYDRIP
jgi:hypothetical protein